MTPRLKLLLTVLLVCMVVGCAPQLPPDEGRYQACQAGALAKAELTANRLCPEDEVEWLACEHRDAIMNQLKADQEACRA